MKEITTLLNRLSEAKKFLDENNLKDPHKLARTRTKLAVLIADIGEHIPEFKKHYAQVEHNRKSHRAELRRKGMSLEESKMQSEYKFLGEEAEAEYWYLKIRQAHQDGVNLLNAIATEIKAIEMEIKLSGSNG